MSLRSLFALGDLPSDRVGELRHPRQLREVDLLDRVVGLVVLHNAIALLLGYVSSRLIKLNDEQARAVTLEVGIQNSGLGLIIVFNFFPNLGGMMIITAFWGVWHLASGLTLALLWSKKTVTVATTSSL